MSTLAVTISNAQGYNYSTRTPLLRKHGIDECGCQLCETERKDPVETHKNRAAAVTAFPPLSSSILDEKLDQVDIDAFLKQALMQFAAIASSYDAAPRPWYLKPDLFMVCSDVRVRVLYRWRS